MNKLDDTDDTRFEETRELLAEAERRFGAVFDMLPPEIRQEVDEGKISRHEVSTILLDCLLNDAAVWQAAQKLLTAKRPRAKVRPSLMGKVDQMRRLAVAFNAYAGAPPHVGRSLSSLVRNFRKTLGSEYGWLRGMSHERIEDLIQEGRKLLVPGVDRLVSARRASLESSSQDPSRAEPHTTRPESESLETSDLSAAFSSPSVELFLPDLTPREASFLRLIKREK
jgi:hypothetical protein